MTETSVVSGSGVGAVRRAVAGLPRRVWAWVSGDPRSTASTGFVAIAAVSVLVAMFLADGFRATSYDLRDSGVWVVNEQQQKVGRINTQIGEQDGVRSVPGGKLAVVQDGADVFVRDGDEWKRVDPASLETGEPLELPTGAQVDLAGGTFAAMDSQGRVWTADAAEAEQLVASTSEEPAGGGTGGVLPVVLGVVGLGVVAAVVALLVRRRRA